MKELSDFSKSTYLTIIWCPSPDYPAEPVHSKLFAVLHCEGKYVPLNMTVKHGSHSQKSMILMEILLKMLNLKPEHIA